MDLDYKLDKEFWEELRFCIPCTINNNINFKNSAWTQQMFINLNHTTSQLTTFLEQF
jgi:hypothetical protein